MIWFLAIASALFGVAVGFYFRRRHYNIAVIWTGATLEVAPCKPTNAGFKVRRVELPAPYSAQVEYAGRASLPSFTLYMCPIEPMQLLEHREMDRWRGKVLRGTVFRPGSDVVQLLQIGFYAAGIGMVLWLALSLGSLTGSMKEVLVAQEALQERVQAVEQRLNQPLEVK